MAAILHYDLLRSLLNDNSRKRASSTGVHEADFHHSRLAFSYDGYYSQFPCFLHRSPFAGLEQGYCNVGTGNRQCTPATFA